MMYQVSFQVGFSIELDYANDNSLIYRAWGFGLGKYNLSKRKIDFYFDEDSMPDSFVRYYSYFVIGNEIFYYGENDNVFYFDNDGKHHSTMETIQRLAEISDNSEIIETYYYHAYVNKIEKLRNSGNYILVNDTYYISHFEYFLDFYSNILNISFYRNKENFDYRSTYSIFPGKRIQDISYIGCDEDSIHYWHILTKEDKTYSKIREEYIIAFSQYGDFLLKKKVGHWTNIDYEYVYDIDSYPTSNSIYTVSNTGDLWFLVRYADIEYKMYKYPRTWGTPNRISIAVNGLLGGDYNDYVKDVLSSFTKEELRIQRNYLFALNHYEFGKKNLKEYFSQYYWYQPDPKIKSSTDYMTEAQLKLLEYIQELENQEFTKTKPDPEKSESRPE